MKPLIAVSGAVSQKCVMRKRQDVNGLSRKKQFHGQMSWDIEVMEKQTGFFLQEISEYFSSKGQCESQGRRAHCISQARLDTEKNILRNQHLRNTL